VYVHRETLKEKNKAKKQPRNMRNLLALVLGAAAGLAAVEDPWCCSAGVAPESDCKGLDQHDCEFHVPQCAWGPSKDCPLPPPLPTCCSAGVAPESDCKGLDQHDCEFHVPQCAWGPSKICPPTTREGLQDKRAALAA
jgi:hypothetical protein